MARGMVSAAQPEAAEAGALVIRDGGNAIDGAIAAALVQTAVDPQMSGIAGFGSFQVLMPGQGVHASLDFHGRCPASVTEDMWQDLLLYESEDGFGFNLEGEVNDIGYQSITTPNSLKAYATALEKWGTRSLGQVMEAAIHYCEQGFMVRPHVAYYWNLVEGAGRVVHSRRLTDFPATAKIYVKPDGTLRTPGEILKNPDMGATYRRIAAGGSDVFYHGEIADQIDADMRANGGLLRKADLESVAPEELAPLEGSYRGHRITTNHPPGGGIMIIEMLNILDNFDLVGMGHNSSEYLRVVAEAMKIATVDKDLHVGDPRFVDVPVDRLTSKAYAAEMAAKIKAGEKTHVPRLGGKGADNKDTTQVCAVDVDGNCVSMTHSLGMSSGVVTDGLGFMYNGCMNVFDPRPGMTGSLAPGKARFTAMCPTMVFRDDKPFLMIGAPGGTYITMGVLQGILNAVDFGMSAESAVAAPRICVTSDVIDLTNRIPRFVEADLKSMGYETRRSYLSHHFAGVHAIRLTDEGWDGGADPGRDGMAIAL